MTWVADLVEFSVAGLTSEIREELWLRGVSDSQMDLYQIGYLDRELPDGLPPHFLDWAKGGSKLDGVFVFPLTTALGEVRGFQFRHVERSKSGYMDYFLARQEPCLFGLGQALPNMWGSRKVYLVEGVFDLFPVQRATPWVVATLTARATPQTVRMLRRVAKQVWLGYDMDAAGRRGCAEFESANAQFFESVYTVTYPKVNGVFTKDPGDLWEAWGDDQMVPYLKSVLEKESLFAI